ncbi:hypothetical protein DM860_017931 [Cuscuta australis]|uniref:Uncharacterized protein n=1 Tax=Cuscuta australis TaxID=267555 RepID=A0A328DV26_9ASTE|nr:hypothetical protein DM860_017931 [Cuscuta australis]
MSGESKRRSSTDSDLEAFSHNPVHGSFAPLTFQPNAMTNCANQRFLSKSRHRTIKKQRRYERLAATSQLSLCYEYDRAWTALGPPYFQGPPGRTGHHATCDALPTAGPNLLLSRFQGGQCTRQTRCLSGFPRPLCSTNPCASAMHVEPFPSAPTAAPPRLTPEVLQHSTCPPTHWGLALAPTAEYRSHALAPSIFGAS